MAIPEKKIVSREDLLIRVKLWKGRPNLMVHKVLDKVINSSSDVSKDDLLDFITNHCKSKNAQGVLGSLRTSGGNHFGRVLTGNKASIILVPELEKEIREIWA